MSSLPRKRARAEQVQQTSKLFRGERISETAPSESPVRKWHFVENAPNAKNPLCPNTYFEWLSDDAIGNIVRYTSSKPRRRKWTDFMKPAHILTVLRSGAMSNRWFRKLDTSIIVASRSCREEFSDMREEYCKRIREDHVMLHELMSAAASTLVELMVDKAFPFSCLAMGFPNLKSLTVTLGEFRLAFNTRMLSSCKLHALDLTGKTLWAEDVDVVIRHCITLQSLRLAFSFVVGDRLPHLFQRIAVALNQLHLAKLETVGNEEIQDNWIVQYLPHMWRNCKNLRHVGLHGCDLLLDTEEYIKVVSIYGKQLESLDLGNCEVPVRFLRKALALCPQVSITGLRLERETDLLLTMGSRAESVVLLNENKKFAASEVERIASQCRYISKLTLSVPICQVVAYFSYLHPRLQDLDITVSGTFRDKATRIFEAVAKSKTIQKFKYVGALPSTKSFREFVCENQLLRDLEMHCTDPSFLCACHPELKWRRTKQVRGWGPVMEILAESSKVQNVTLSCASSPNFYFNAAYVNEYNLFRFRPFFSANLCGHDYF